MKKMFPFLVIVGFLSASTPQKQIVDDEIEKVFQLLNELRATGCSCGENYYAPAPEVIWSETLEEAAKRHAQDMFEYDFMDHIGSDGTGCVQRAEESGYEGVYVGENVAVGPMGDPEGLMGAWQASPDHCENMMDTRFLEVGIAKVDNPENGLSYWVQVFGEPDSEE